MGTFFYFLCTEHRKKYNRTKQTNKMHLCYEEHFNFYDVLYVFRTRGVHLQVDGCMYRYVIISLHVNKLYHTWNWKAAAIKTGWRKETGEAMARK